MKYHFLHERGDYPILATEEIASVWSGDIKKSVACGVSPLCFIYQNGWARIYGSHRANQKNIDFIFKKINQDKKYVSKIKRIFVQQAKKFLNFVCLFNATNFKELSNREIIILKEKYTELYHQAAPYGEPLPFFLKEKLYQFLNNYLINQLKISDKDYQVLINSSYQSFIEREKKELLDLSKKAKNKKQLDELIEAHSKKYQWIIFDYASLVATPQYFRELLSEMKKQ